MSTKNSTKANQQVGIFVVNNQAEYPWTCYAFTPNPNGGKKIKSKLKVRFKHIPKSERLELLDEFKEKLAAAQKVGENPQSDDDADTLHKLVSFQRMLLDRALTWFEAVDTSGTRSTPTMKARRCYSTTAGPKMR